MNTIPFSILERLGVPLTSWFELHSWQRGLEICQLNFIHYFGLLEIKSFTELKVDQDTLSLDGWIDSVHLQLEMERDLPWNPDLLAALQERELRNTSVLKKSCAIIAELDAQNGTLLSRVIMGLVVCHQEWEKDLALTKKFSTTKTRSLTKQNWEWFQESPCQTLPLFLKGVSL